MELRHLRYFVMVAREQSFTRAAESFRIAQPPLSRQIQQLEEELGVALIQRSSRPAFLTEAGAERHDAPGLGDELVPGVAAVVDDVVVGARTPGSRASCRAGTARRSPAG